MTRRETIQAGGAVLVPLQSDSGDGWFPDLSGILPWGDDQEGITVSESGSVVAENITELDAIGGISIKDAGDGIAKIETLGESGEAAYDEIDHIVDHPDRLPIAGLADGDSIEIPVSVPDSYSLEVYRWEAYDVADGSAPSGLTVELLDESDTIHASENTAGTQDKSSPVASHTNSTGSESIYKLRANNGTGSSLGLDSDASPGVGATFGFRVV